MSVVAIEKDWIIGSLRIDHFFRGQLRRAPLRLVPASVKNPLAFGSVLSSLRDPTHKLLRAGCVVKLNGVELRATLYEVHMRIIEAREHQLFSGINHSRLGAVPCVNLFGRAQGNDSF